MGNYVLSDSDVEVLKRVLGMSPKSRPATGASYTEDVDQQAPETYVARLESGSIDALTDSDPTGTATSTSSVDIDDIPGKVTQCQLYRIQDDILVKVPGLKRDVYNVTDSALTSEYVLVTRTKAGRWVAAGAGGGGTDHLTFQVLAAGPSLGDMSAECDYVVAEILNYSCGASGLTVGEEINIWDPHRCHFDVPLPVLIGAKGIAVEMVNDTDGVVDCIDDRADEGSCLWQVHHLCCCGEVWGGS